MTEESTSRPAAREKAGPPAPSFLTGITILLVYQLFGELTVAVAALPIPGPVVGMLALFLTLVIRKHGFESLEVTASTLLRHLSLLFVPAGVGVMVHVQRLGAEWLPIGAALLLSTVLSLAATALVMNLLVRRRRGSSAGGDVRGD